MDSIIKNHKKKVDEAHLEKDKCLVRQRMLESQLNKIQEDSQKCMEENNKQHENLLEK
jgi:hypothetical protein